MKIAFISTILTYRWGGADTLWTKAAEAAVERGDSVLMAISALTAESERVQRLVARGARLVIREPKAPARSLASRAVSRLRTKVRPDALVDTMAEFDPELVIVSGGGTYDLSLEPALVQWVAGKKIRLRVVANWQQENPTAWAGEREAMRHAFGLADKLFFVSTRNLAATRRNLLLPLPNASVVHNPLRSLPETGFAWPEENTWRLATVGRLEWNKGIALLLHALAGGLAHEHEWRLDIFGQGGDEAYLGSTIQSLGLGDRVRQRGHVGTLAEIWSSNHLLISPAIEEGVPMTIPEAMLCGRLSLATRVGGAEDWIRHGETGFLCAAPKVELLSDSLREAWAQRKRWRQMATAATADAWARYRPDDYLKLIA